MMVSVDLVSSELLSFTCRVITSHFVLTWPFICFHAPQIFSCLFIFSFLIRTLVCLVKAHPNVSFKLNHLFKGTISKYSHNLKHWGLGLQCINFFGGGINSPILLFLLPFLPNSVIWKEV